MKIAICHQGFAAGDAIGNDMAGMYRVLERMRLEPVVVCDWSSRKERFRIVTPRQADWQSFDLVIYHHSQYWELGDCLVRYARCPILFKYHNITPAHYFKGYFPLAEEMCARGREQTSLLRGSRAEGWLADSSFSRNELIETGAAPEHVRVLPPFNRVTELLPLRHRARYDLERFNVLFVGRVTPHKGHFHLLRVAALLLDEFGRSLLLRIVGGWDEALNSYVAELRSCIDELDLRSHVEIVTGCSDAEVIRLYQHSHLYLCLSEHEGFNVPLIEAQAIGLPLLGASAGASAETAGPDQLFSAIPTSSEDDYFYAALANEILRNSRLRNQLTFAGERNVRGRFTDEVMENAFVEEVYRACGGEERLESTPAAACASGAFD